MRKKAATQKSDGCTGALGAGGGETTKTGTPDARARRMASWVPADIPSQKAMTTSAWATTSALRIMPARRPNDDQAAGSDTTERPRERAAFSATRSTPAAAPDTTATPAGNAPTKSDTSDSAEK